MSKAWEKIVAKIRRRWGSFEFVRVWELHKSGYPHLHIVSRGTFIAQKWLSAEWDKMGCGKIVDIRKIENSKHATIYITKYLGKSFGTLTKLWSGTRLVNKSNHWLPENWQPVQRVKREGWSWGAISKPFWQVVSDLASAKAIEVAFDTYSFAITMSFQKYLSAKARDYNNSLGLLSFLREYDPGKEIVSIPSWLQPDRSQSP
jgi:hypothetical protein